MIVFVDFYFTMSVPDEGYSTNTSFALHFISSFLFLFYYERNDVFVE